MMIKISTTLLLAIFSICNAGLLDEYDHFAALDPDENVKLYWTIDEETVSFALDGATKGWVGFGVSTGQGKMDKADMVIGWVKDGKPYLSDRHGVGHYPALDDHNDYKLISGMEDNGRTIIKFSRKIDTCDKQDQVLQEGTSKVIFALSDDDPESPESVKKHTFKGIRSILLLNNMGRSSQKPGSSWKHFDAINKNYSLPAVDTVYHCAVHKLPEFKEKNHLVRFDPVVQRGHEGVVHHLVAYVCDHDFPEYHKNFSGLCYDFANMPAEVIQCMGKGILVAVWGVGGGAFLYPKDAGLPIGGEYTGRHVILEIHYDNPKLRNDIVDNSGVRLYYTNRLRKYDAGVMSVGSMILPWIMIPPHQQSWKTTGYCSKECTKEALRNTSLPGGGIKIFSCLLHTHLAGAAIWTRHIRNGVELPEIARDNNYDFNFQDIQRLRKEVHIKPGDDIIHTCVYNTMKRKQLTYMGLSTREEMCLNFIYYYPILPKEQRSCTSVNIKAGEAILNKYYPELKASASLIKNPIVASNKTWTKDMTDYYRKILDEETQFLGRPICNKQNTRSKSLEDVTKDKYQNPTPKVTTSFSKPNDRCKDVDSSATELVHNNMLFHATGLFAVLLFIYENF